MQLTVITFVGKRTTLEVEPSDTIRTVKTKYERKHDLHPDHQRLSLPFGDGGKSATLEDGLTLADYDIQDGAKVFLWVTGPLPTEIYVKTPSNEVITLDVKTSETVDGVKAMIHDRSGIPPGEQTLVFAGKELEGGGERTLEDYRIRNYFVLNLHSRSSGGATRARRSEMRIFVMTREKRIVTVEVEPTSTVREVKALIEERVGGYPPKERQDLRFAGRRLRDGLTLAEHSIEDDFILTVDFDFFGPCR